MKMPKKMQYLLAGMAASVCLLAQAQAQSYPDRTVRWAVPYAAGGASDIVTRIVAQRMAANLGQPVVVENRPGAATILATDEFVLAKPDGYRILTAAGSALTLHPELGRKLRYEAERDFDYVSGLIKLPMIMVVNKDLGIKNLPELIAYIKKANGNVSYASVGMGSPHHLVAESFLKQIDAKATHIPYNGTMASLMDVVAGRIPFSITDLATSSPLIKKGELIALAVPSDARSPVFPDVPTFNEAGTPLVGFAWHGVVVPKGTPPEIIAIINKEIVDTLNDPATAKRLHDMGTEILPVTTPAQLREFVKSERAKWGELIRSRGLTVE